MSDSTARAAKLNTYTNSMALFNRASYYPLAFFILVLGRLVEQTLH